jgi:PhzF family phenazine biosynthesis protein
MPLSFHLVDAFASRAFTGNPAAVYVLEGWPAADWLQLVAREMNQSETAFLVKNIAGYDLRWFTPKVEVDLCGHATLASAHVLWETGQAEGDQPIAFATKSGMLTASRRKEAIELDFPLLREEPTTAPTGVAEALGIQPVYVGKSRHDLIVEADSEASVRSLKPDMTRLAAVATRGVIVTARSVDSSFDFVSRFFAPAAGIPEDPATGSAHCVLADFWQKRLGKSEFAAVQASERGGVLSVRVSGERAILGGRALTVARGELL